MTEMAGNNRPNPGDGVTRLYTLVEVAMMNMPSPDAGRELRPSEIAQMKELLNKTWESIRAWLETHPNQMDREQAAMHQGHLLTTTLHMVCKLMDPPVDIVQSLIECAPETVTWPDSNEWLPLHHACANGASGKVLSILVEAYPDGKLRQDKRKRTPLHFAFFRKDANGENTTKESTDGNVDDIGSSMPDIVRLLSDSGAAELPDEGGMLPMHYACAYGTTPEVLQVLLENYPESIIKRENKGRNPLHLAMVNAHRRSSPKVVGFLLEDHGVGIASSDIINVYDDDNHLPIHLLAMASRFPAERVYERQNASACLELYLEARPQASADFLTAVQTLPEWLRDKAVLSDHIQNILNHKIVMRFPTMMLIMDAFFLMLAIVLFEITTGETIDYLFTKNFDDPQPQANIGKIAIVLFCGAYFLAREIVQIVSLVTLGNFNSWYTDMGNWLDVTLIFFLFYFGAVMLANNPVSGEMFRSGTAIAKGFLWISVISWMKSTQVEFSVFVSGVTYVVERLAAFLLALCVILLMFAQMFYIVYDETELCSCGEMYPQANPFPHCTFQDSLMKVYTMLMGEIGNEMRYATSRVAQFLYVTFAFLVVILLSNVLIAIVTDSYGVIKNERAAMVFWSNRLDFVAEMDSIKNVWKRIKKLVVQSDEVEGAPSRVRENPEGDPTILEEDEGNNGDRLRNGWKTIMNLFDPNLYETYDVNPSSFEFWCYVLVRFAAIFFIIPVWLIIGLCTAGFLWPPQVREYLFQQKKAAISRADMAEQITAQINELQKEIRVLRADLKGELKNDRREFTLVRAEVDAVKAEVMADLLQVKEIMMTLLDMTKSQVRT
mmetsp:Transcript_26686/g.55289  ORF Transcript_26686/g.55289 Transcript_26686/m.55289 type:complete len:834 (-) Transcript_26686:352-2853(-)